MRESDDVRFGNLPSGSRSASTIAGKNHTFGEITGRTNTIERGQGAAFSEEHRGNLRILVSRNSEAVPGPVITTNFDHVIETAFVDAGRPFVAVITGPQPDSVIGAMHRNEHALIKIHGDARDRSARALTEEEYKEQ